MSCFESPIKSQPRYKRLLPHTNLETKISKEGQGTKSKGTKSLPYTCRQPSEANYLTDVW